MPGRKSQTGISSYRYSINGQEKCDELNYNMTYAKYWEYDSRIERRWNIDPIIKIDESPYLCFSGNPILISDVLGNSGNSTHVDKDNKILAVYNDGDLSVYKHESANSEKDVDALRKKYKNTSGNGTKIGETHYCVGSPYFSAVQV